MILNESNALEDSHGFVDGAYHPKCDPEHFYLDVQRFFCLREGSSVLALKILHSHQEAHAAASLSPVTSYEDLAAATRRT